jgi:hypothetical protein
MNKTVKAAAGIRFFEKHLVIGPFPPGGRRSGRSAGYARSNQYCQLHRRLVHAGEGAD